MPAVPQTKATWTNGLDPLNSTNLHAYLRDPLRFLMRRPAAELRRTTPQAIANGIWASVLFTVEDLDDDIDAVGGHSTSVNTSRYTARYPGWYLVSGGVVWDPDTTGRRASRWAKNGSAIDGSELFTQPTSGAEVGVVSRTKLISLNEGDYVEHQVWHNRTGGTALNVSATIGEVQPSMSVVWMRLQ